MKTIIALVIAAVASASAMADATVTNADKQFDVKVQYRTPGKVYHLSEEAYGVGYDTASATVYPYEEVLVAPGKTASIKGEVIGTIKMVPGPDMTKFFEEHSLG